MKIDHIAMHVNDLEKARAFFIKYFNVKSNEMYHNPKTGFKSYFLTFDDGSRIELMSKPELLNQSINHDYTHLAISVGSKEMVDELTKKLKNDGYKLVSGPRITGDGYYESCVEGIENYLIEITK